MKDRATLSRRALLAMLAAAAVTGPARGLAAAAPGTGAVLHGLLVAERDSAAHLGRAYIAAAPAEADEGSLLRALERSLPELAPAVARRSISDVEGLLAGRIARDYRDGRVTQLDGWIVSRTEARLCALHAVDDMPAAAATS